MSATTLQLTPRRRRAFGMLMATELRLSLRRPTRLIVAVGIPVVLLGIFGSIPATTRPDKAFGGVSFFQLYVPTLLVFVLIIVGLMVGPQQLATYRQQGVLRRMSTTPISPSWLLAAELLLNAMFDVIGIAVIIGVGAIAFDLRLPPTVGDDLAALGALALAAVALLALGMCVAAVASSPQVATGITQLTYIPLAFFSGLYVPLAEIHSPVVHTIAKVLPTGAAFNAVQASFAGHAPSAVSLLVLAGWAAVCSRLAARRFRWE